MPAPETHLKQCLEQDGFVVVDGSLRRMLPAEVGLPVAASELEELLDRHRFVIARGHLDQALEAHARGSWAAANSQLRTFAEAVLDEIAVRIDASASDLESGHPRRSRLAAAGFFLRDLNEWDDQGRGFFNGLMKRLHPQGSHPGLSDEEDSTFRLHLVLLTMRLLMRRFDDWRHE